MSEGGGQDMEAYLPLKDKQPQHPNSISGPLSSYYGDCINLNFYINYININSY
jgi:hypothetical protein